MLDREQIELSNFKEWLETVANFGNIKTYQYNMTPSMSKDLLEAIKEIEGAVG